MFCAICCRSMNKDKLGICKDIDVEQLHKINKMGKIIYKIKSKSKGIK